MDQRLEAWRERQAQGRQGEGNLPDRSDCEKTTTTYTEFTKYHKKYQQLTVVSKKMFINIMLVMKPLGFYYMFGFVLKPSSEDKLLIFMGIKQDLKA